MSNLSKPGSERSRRFFARCPPEAVPGLRAELAGLGADDVRPLRGGVGFRGSLALGYRACLWSRLASRVLLELKRVPADDGDTLYAACREIPWERHFTDGATLGVAFQGRSKALRDSRYGALRIKDAVCDRLRDVTGARPDIDRQQPDIRLHGFLFRGAVILYLDLAGDSLGRRGYRQSAGEAPIRETLAAALLAHLGWPGNGADADTAVLADPMCGSGTLLIEGASMALGLAPGLHRERFGFTAWRQHDADTWQTLVAEARTRRDKALAEPRCRARGCDSDPGAIADAEANIRRAGLEGVVSVEVNRAENWAPPSALNAAVAAGAPGLILTNPPYGERMGRSNTLEALYRGWSACLRAHWGGWRVAAITPDATMVKAMGLPLDDRAPFHNGALACELLVWHVPKTARPDPDKIDEWKSSINNRLQKKYKKLSRWAEREGVTAWRLYDADIPEFAIAVDRYNDWWHIAEYAPPATVDPVQAEIRFDLLREAVAALDPASAEQLAFKTRRRQSGTHQYRARADTDRERGLTVTEGPARFRVNLWDYLDTGLFLDHRPLRRRVHAMARGKRFLNLFAYTGTVSVMAALGGARETLSVDLSNTYRDWTTANFALNDLAVDTPGSPHRTEQADCLAWLASTTGLWDIVYLDPPSFSNSRRMERDLDLQRDHAALIEQAMARVAPDGVLLFSTNRRRFRLDKAVARRFAVTDITDQTLDPDFSRSPPPHRCWEIRHSS